jgi:hypothetical protein
VDPARDRAGAGRGPALGGVIADAFSLEKSTEAFWGLATAAFGIIVGLLGGEKADGRG